MMLTTNSLSIYSTFLAVLFMIFSSVSALAADLNTISRYVPKAERLGGGIASFMFWDIYDAALYAPSGIYEKGKPLALSLTYLMDFQGVKIAERSTKEMRRLGFRDAEKLKEWDAQMKAIFPDVKKGDVLTGVLTPQGKTLFFKGTEKIGEVQDPDFGAHFFDIWLNEKTLLPDLRIALLGNS